MADDASPSEADSSPYQPAPTGNPVGCAILNHIFENAGELPCAKPSSHDVSHSVYTMQPTIRR